MIVRPVSNRTFAGIFPFVRRAEEVVGEIFEAGKLFEFVVGYSGRHHMGRSVVVLETGPATDFLMLRLPDPRPCAKW